MKSGHPEFVEAARECVDRDGGWEEASVLSVPSCDNNKDNALEADPWGSKTKTTQKIGDQSNATDS